jgi:hypothetical protein
MNNQYIGLEFLDCQYELNIVESFSEHYNKYLIRQERQHYSDHSRGLMSDQDIEFYLTKQEDLKRQLQERQERERAEQLQKELELKEYNNTYYYADNFSPLQKGKILKILNTKENIFSEGKYIHTLTRKDFIKQSFICTHEQVLNITNYPSTIYTLETIEPFEPSTKKEEYINLVNEGLKLVNEFPMTVIKKAGHYSKLYDLKELYYKLMPINRWLFEPEGDYDWDRYKKNINLSKTKKELDQNLKLCIYRLNRQLNDIKEMAYNDQIEGLN